MRSEQVEEFEAFVRSRWSQLANTAYLLTGDRHIAEDLTQSALAKAYRHWPRVLAADNPDGYVRRMLVNCSNDWFRRRRVAEQLTDAPPATAPAEDFTDASVARDTLLAALAALPPRQRAVVVLRYWDDMSEAEVARTLGCAVGTVKSQAARGLARLREYPGLDHRVTERGAV